MNKSGDMWSVDDEFMKRAEELKQQWEEQISDVNLETKDAELTQELNYDITEEEIEKCIHNSKSGKAPGIDCIPIDIMKTGNVGKYLWKLFSYCFNNGMIPRQWNQIIIKPIPKMTLVFHQ